MQQRLEVDVGGKKQFLLRQVEVGRRLDQVRVRLHEPDGRPPQVSGLAAIAAIVTAATAGDVGEPEGMAEQVRWQRLDKDAVKLLNQVQVRVLGVDDLAVVHHLPV